MVAVYSSQNQFFGGGGLKLPNRESLRKNVVHLYHRSTRHYLRERGAAVGAASGAYPSLPPPCSERGERINIIYLRNKNAKPKAKSCIKTGTYPRNSTPLP